MDLVLINNLSFPLQATVAGWGTIYFGGPTSQFLQEVDVGIWKNSDCATNYGKLNRKVLNTMLCAGDNIGKDACHVSSTSFILIGINIFKIYIPRVGMQFFKIYSNSQGWRKQMDEQFLVKENHKGHLICKQCLHDLQLKKTRYFSPKLSKLARADIRCQVLFTKRMEFSCHLKFHI